MGRADGLPWDDKVVHVAADEIRYARIQVWSIVYDFEVAKFSLTLEMYEISEISKIVSDKSPNFLFEFE
jgi:hypothetical protein